MQANGCYIPAPRRSGRTSERSHVPNSREEATREQEATLVRCLKPAPVGRLITSPGAPGITQRSECEPDFTGVFEAEHRAVLEMLSVWGIYFLMMLTAQGWFMYNYA